MHDELSIHNLRNISKRLQAGKPVEKVDMALAQSTYMGNSVFHLCYNNFGILESMHKSICGTIVPGEVGEKLEEDTIASKFSKRDDDDVKKNPFESPWFRRVV